MKRIYILSSFIKDCQERSHRNNKEEKSLSETRFFPPKESRAKRALVFKYPTHNQQFLRHTFHFSSVFLLCGFFVLFLSVCQIKDHTQKVGVPFKRGPLIGGRKPNSLLFIGQ